MRIANLNGRLTLIVDDQALDVESASAGLFSADPQAIYLRWEQFLDWAASADMTPTRTFIQADLGAPAPRPDQVFAIGLNYRDHAAESGLTLPDSPTVFTKFVSCITGPSGDVVLAGPTVDWEVELVAVIGKTARRVPVENGWDHVAGLTAGHP